MSTLWDLEPKAASGEPFTRAEAERVAACVDLVSVGVLGESARHKRHDRRVTFAQVCAISATLPPDVGEAGDVRLMGRPASADDAIARVRDAAVLAKAVLAKDVPLTGFSLADLLELVGHDHLALADVARTLKRAGLEAVAEAPIDRLDDAAEVIRAVRHGGLSVWRLTVDRADHAARLDLIERARDTAREVGGIHAFAPLPRNDPRETPSTGYDDVRTIAVARLVCTDIASIQVDWQLYGPKLAQVAIAYGADDIDAVAAVDTLGLGARRSPRADIERQITAAFATPAARNGRYELIG
jgi:aminodeoxyfutalosine synthase